MCNLKSQEVIEIKQNLSLEFEVIRIRILQIFRQLEIIFELLQNNTPNSKPYTDPLVEHWTKSLKTAVFFYRYLRESSQKITKPILLKILLHITRRFSNKLQHQFF